jgi:hypothetical protein
MLKDFIDMNLPGKAVFLHHWSLHNLFTTTLLLLACITYCTSQEIPDWNGVLALICGLVAQLRIAAKKLQ